MTRGIGCVLKAIGYIIHFGDVLAQRRSQFSTSGDEGSRKLLPILLADPAPHQKTSKADHKCLKTSTVFTSRRRV